MTTKKVFCSHRGIDKPTVEDFARRLREAGIDAWLDKWEIAPGDNIVARSLKIAQRLVQAEPERADYQRDLVVSLMRIATIDATRSATCLREALAILQGLKSTGRQIPDLGAMIESCEGALSPRESAP